MQDPMLRTIRPLSPVHSFCGVNQYGILIFYNFFFVSLSISLTIHDQCVAIWFDGIGCPFRAVKLQLRHGNAILSIQSNWNETTPLSANREYFIDSLCMCLTIDLSIRLYLKRSLVSAFIFRAHKHMSFEIKIFKIHLKDKQRFQIDRNGAILCLLLIILFKLRDRNALWAVSATLTR